MGRAVLLDGYRPHDELARVVASEPHLRIVHSGVRFGWDTHHTQLADRPAGDRLQPLIDVQQDHLAFLRARLLHDLGELRRFRSRPDRQRIHRGNRRIAVDEVQIAKRVEQVNPHSRRPGRVARVGQRLVAPRDQVVLFGEWIRIGEIRAGPGFDFGKRHLGRQPGHRAVAVEAFAQIQQHQAAGRVPVMGRSREDDLVRVGDRAGLEHAVRVGRVVAEDGPGARAIGQRRPEAHVGHVDAIDVIPAAVQDATVVGHAGRPLEHLEGRNLPKLLALGVHHVQRVDGHGPIGSAAATDVTVAQLGVDCRHGAFSPALDVLPPPRREENDLTVGQIPAVEVVVLPARQTPQPRTVEFHFVEMIEGIFRDFRFVELVDDAMHVRVILAIGEQHLAPVV